ncbi:MAG: molybdopterin-guanine dinucleotide biosynthesis protein B [Anaerolineae bacterium]|jgi:molybdopterin-guanine dinucleotide biosynthesis protein B
MSTVPIICVVGRSESGKTTLLEKLIREFKRRGHRVATVKHHSHSGLDFDRPGKDTWRHAQAGSDHVVIASPDRLASIRRVDREPTLDEIAGAIHDVDVILAEGYKRTGQIKVEVVRAARSSEPLCTPSELLALVTDVDIPYDVRQFGLNDASGLADLVEKLL